MSSKSMDVVSTMTMSWRSALWDLIFASMERPLVRGIFTSRRMSEGVVFSGSSKWAIASSALSKVTTGLRIPNCANVRSKSCVSSGESSTSMIVFVTPEPMEVIPLIMDDCGSKYWGQYLSCYICGGGGFRVTAQLFFCGFDDSVGGAGDA